jgi:D-alanine-D-alanine ligase
MFVKPVAEGSSFGASKAETRGELLSAAEYAFSHGGKILIEKYVKGREIEVAALEMEGEQEVYISSAGEIVTGEGFYDYDTKYVNDKATLHIPASLEENVQNRLKEIARKVFSVLECKGFARIDFFVEGEDIYFNEINTLPGFTHISMYPKLMEHDGVSYTELITKLVETASL